jgi:hypothetical protein
MTAVKEIGSPNPMPMMQAVNAVLMERTPFGIDDAKDDEEDDEDLDEGVGDGVMDEVSNSLQVLVCGEFWICSKVDAFLEAHDSGLTEEDKKVASGEWLAGFPHLELFLILSFLDLLHAEPVK